MANKERGYVAIELDKPRRLRYDLNALAEIEEGTGKPLTELNQGNMGVRDIRLILWAGLVHEDPNLTQRDVGAMVSGENLGQVMDKLKEALELAIGSPKNVPKGPSGTGKQ